MEEISLLEPGETAKRVLQVHFHHHLLPLKLVLWCNGKKHPVKLRPDIGYFIKPLPMDVEAFLNKEGQLPGMFEYKRRSDIIIIFPSYSPRVEAQTSLSLIFVLQVLKISTVGTKITLPTFGINISALSLKSIEMSIF